MRKQSSHPLLACGSLFLSLCLATFALTLTGCDLTPTKETEIKASPELSTHFQPVSTEGMVFASGGLVFVPVYSHVEVEAEHAPLTTNLTVHNTDLEKPIFITSLRFFDHSGKLLKDYLKESHSLGPMGSAEFFVEPSLSHTETALSFVVEWKAEGQVNEPVIEAVMANQSGTHAFAFVTTGRKIGRTGSGSSVHGVND